MASARALSVADLGAQIQAGLCVDIEGVQSSEVVLTGLLLDDSASMTPYSQTVIEEYQRFIAALRASKARDDIMVHTRFLSGAILNPFVLVKNAPSLDSHTYTHP